MATYGDFSSLLQLGVGVGIGLSLFRAPVDLRVAKLSRTLSGEITALQGSQTQFGKRKRRDMRDLELAFVTIRLSLERRQVPFMVCALLLAALNLSGLIVATIDKDRTACGYELCGLLLVTVGGFLLLLGAMEIMARAHLSGVTKELRELQARRAPSAAAELAYAKP